MLQKRTKSFFHRKSIVGLFLLIIFVFGLFFSSSDNFVKAADVLTTDKIAEGQRTSAKAKEEWWKKLADALKKAGSKAFGSALTSALNTIAYDTATWIGSGDDGQKPKFLTEDWETGLTNLADNAAGTFLEELGNNGFSSFNLCEPDLSLNLTISLGLIQYKRPESPDCSFSEMASNWKSEVDRWRDMNKDEFLGMFQNSLDPVSNNIGVALTLQTKMFEKIKKEERYYAEDRKEGGGWLEFDSLSGIREAYPNNPKMQAEMSNQLMTANFAVWTGDALIDAGNIFLNQLAITYFQRKMQELLDSGSESTSSPYAWDDLLSNADRQSSSGGISGLKNSLKGVITPNFTTRGDYDILAELSICPDESHAGPTNCVINNNFAQAIINKLTVAEAIDQGYLNAGGIFGFQNQIEPSYTEAYPYRSMIILRKFRILPVGWELAAQYIYEYYNQDNIKTFSLGDLVGCFDANDNYVGALDGEDWCVGLVDPNWVLKAPLNYCARSGPGAEIINSSIVGTGQNSELMISRNEDYCADEQSCIDENDDGSCRFFGYCVEEKRKWRFDGESCEANFNSCQTFRSSEGDTISYLKNTLDYDSCSIDNVGCQEYCTDYDFANSNWSCTEDDGSRIYFDKDVEECDEESEGCHEFIRTKSGLGTNLIKNSSFEDSLAGSIWSGLGSQSVDGYDGVRSLNLTSDVDKYIDVGPSGYSLTGRAYTLSFYAKNCGGSGEFGLGTNLELELKPLATSDSWSRFQLSYIYPSYYLDNKVRMVIRDFGSSCSIDGIKLENNKTATAYNDYRESGLIYEKVLPNYLASSCYVSSSDFSFKSDVPDECDGFARKCNQDEVGCEMFTSVRDKISVPAQVVEEDYCPSECVGYDGYVQSKTIFDSMRDAYFIPKSAQSCKAEAVGCDEFTNLDEAVRGGEGKEYYTYLRQCVKSGDSSCSEFYTWEGSDEAGYQLKVFQLQTDGGEPFVTEDDSLMCNESIYNLSESDPSYNEDCREFYSKDGNVSYHLYTRTVTCSDDCHTYRRTAVNNDPSILTQGDCSSADGQWFNGACVVCENNGRWDSQHGACLYDAIPGEGTVCSASYDGCRKYVGNFGNNTKTVLSYYFEGSTQGWTGLNSAELSGESLTVGGESLYINGGQNTAFVTVGNLVQTGKSYSLNFIVKPGTATKITSVSFVNSLNEKDNFASVDLGSGWQFYKISLANLNNRVDVNEKLVIAANGSFYLDNVELIEVMDQYYLIKDSWSTPESCDQNASGDPSPLFMLGCAEYRDRDNLRHYLHSFNNLCQESAVGCELLIDTSNYSDSNTKTFNDNDPSEIIVPADSFVYTVYDRDKECNQRDKGCQRVGNPYKYDGEYFYGDVWYKNNPDKYNEILCYGDEVGCQEWSGDSLSYFKDPGDQVCEWRLAYQGDWGWYKKKIKRCDDNVDNAGEGDVCVTDEDCDESIKCKLETVDTPCPVRADKTFGQSNEKIFQPSMDDNDRKWVGVCAAESSGCTEYIDPISSFSTNIIANADFAIANNSWTGNSQQVTLLPNTLYSLSVEGDNSVSLSDTVLGLFELGEDNKLSFTGSNSISVSSVSGRASKLFYTLASSTDAVATITVGSKTGEVGLREVVLDYQIKGKLDKTSCNGLVDFEDGCVLFNEREYSGSNLSNLVWDADLTVIDNNGVSPEAGVDEQADSNVILKVRPDRKCGEWMACTQEEVGYVDGEPTAVCQDVGLCDRIDDNGECIRFVDNRKENETYMENNGSQFSNRSGYSKVGLTYNPEKTLSLWPNNLYPFGFMETKGEVVSVTNSGFEFAYDADAAPEYDSDTGDMVSSGDYGDYGDVDLPNYWEVRDDQWTTTSCGGECRPEIIDDPVEAAQEDVCYTENDFGCELYTPEGKNFLKLPANNFGYVVLQSSAATLYSKTNNEYVFSVFMNTSALTAGQAVAAIQQYNESGSVIQTDYATLDYLKGWTFVMKKFTAKSNAKSLKITLYTYKKGDSSDPYGSAYFDDIKIRPALEVSELDSGDHWDVGQTCRLYPESDSFSCDYYKGSTSSYDKGVRYKGWLGHCLEYDRYPGSSETCLLWWPVPHTTNKVDEWCGDDQITGDEDCECDPYSESEDLIFSCSLYGVEANNVWGTDVGHQYECQNCNFKEGWCGDNVLQKNMGEECDWNEVTADPNHSDQDPNLDETTLNSNVKHFSCAYAPSEEPGEAPVAIPLEKLSTGSYKMTDYATKYASQKGKYLYSKYGDLGCYQAGSGAGKQCTFNYEVCSEYLGYEGLSGRHTRQQCIAAGGEVMNKNGEVVIQSSGDLTKDPGGIIVSPNVSKDEDNNGLDDYYPYFCRFTAPYVGAFAFDNKGQGSIFQDVCSMNYFGWHDHTNWDYSSSQYGQEFSAGYTNMCDGNEECTGVAQAAINPLMAVACQALGTGDWVKGDVGIIDGCSGCGNAYVAPTYDWMNVTLSCGPFQDGSCDWLTGDCSTDELYCCAIPTMIGCY